MKKFLPLVHALQASHEKLKRFASIVLGGGLKLRQKVRVYPVSQVQESGHRAPIVSGGARGVGVNKCKHLSQRNSGLIGGLHL